MSWDGGMMGGGGLTDDDVYAAMAAATAHSQAAAEVAPPAAHPQPLISLPCAPQYLQPNGISRPYKASVMRAGHNHRLDARGSTGEEVGEL